MVDDIYTVRPYILRKDVYTEREKVAVATVDGVQSLIVPISEEIARSVAGVTGTEAQPATVEEIELLCATHGICAVGLFGLDDGDGLDVFAVETLAMVLEES